MLTAGSSSPLRRITVPVVSRPRRPARPAICVYSPGKRFRKEWPSCLRIPANTTHFAGILTPCVLAWTTLEISLTHHRKCFCGEKNFHKTAREQELNDLCRYQPLEVTERFARLTFDKWQQSTVVNADTPSEQFSHSCDLRKLLVGSWVSVNLSESTRHTFQSIQSSLPCDVHLRLLLGIAQIHVLKICRIFLAPFLAEDEVDDG